ncbi:MAG: BtpA/SgcQ family protein [Candidatus Caldarchaeum sp.]|uniref:BtpA/SgcQ family protein n=1 Tax=Caldiarchaeum subterraneum TaxID=311458 RepID=A0A7C4I256_CALS0
MPSPLLPMKPDALKEIFKNTKPIIAMIHLPPLPGAPRYSGMSVEDIIEYGLRDAEVLKSNDVDGLQVENIGDYPYLKPDDIGHETSSILAVMAREVRKSTGLPVGICCLANGVIPAIAACVASGGKWVRAAEWANAYIADEGFVEAIAHRALRYRANLRAYDVRVFADVNVKHGSHFIISDRPFEEQVADAEFFDADAIIVSGTRTGAETPLEKVVRAKQATSLPVLVGSGLNADNAENLLKVADGAIVGSYLRRDGKFWNPVEPERVKKLMSVVKKLR